MQENEYAGKSPAWWVYMLRCADGSLYTGSTDDVERRAACHNQGKGAKYTRGRRPVTVVYREACPHRSAALKREAAIKKLARKEKERLIESGPPGEPPQWAPAVIYPGIKTVSGAFTRIADEKGNVDICP
ncbi:MAG: GIY-YIG nuclease family protein [Peptococcaceae bacterium]|nr:GIY-YIG nuclease family protein [Peptococcaceae bacterium]